IKINSGGSGVIYKSEFKCCKITIALKRLKDSIQNQHFNSEVGAGVLFSEYNEELNVGLVMEGTAMREKPVMQQLSERVVDGKNLDKRAIPEDSLVSPERGERAWETVRLVRSIGSGPPVFRGKGTVGIREPATWTLSLSSERLVWAVEDT
ncbi:17824_t:CDS:2, partial [Cetraspora pellucida]